PAAGVEGRTKHPLGSRHTLSSPPASENLNVVGSEILIRVRRAYAFAPRGDRRAAMTRIGRSDTAIVVPRPLEPATVAALRSLANRFGRADGTRKVALLHAAADGRLCD